MKILLIYPPVSVCGEGKVSPHMPLGLAYIASTLEKNNYEVKIVDALAMGKDIVKRKGKITQIGLSDAMIKKEIIKFKPEVVGISVMFTAFKDDAYRMAKIVKSIDNKILTIFGGAHVSIDVREVLKNKEVDVAVKGEGEDTFIKLLKVIERKGDLNDVLGISFKKGRKIIETKMNPMIKNLDDLPFPARHLLPMNLYDDKKSKFSIAHPAMTMITSRGCPNHCVYCSIHSVWEHKWRGRSAKNVVDEIEEMVNKYKAKEIAFLDDSMSVDKRRMNEICDQIIKRKIKFYWTTPNGIAHWTLDKKLLKKMKKAGCYRITFGIESGNLEMRRWVGKPFSLKQAKELTQYANKIGMWTIATNIIGFPYETREQIEDTVKFAIDSDVDFALFYRLGVRKGTPIYEIFKKEKWLPTNEKELFSEEVCCETKNFKGDDLFKIQNEIYSKFLKRRIKSFLNPIRIIRKIHSVNDFKYVVGLGIAGLKLTKNLVTSKKGVTSKSLRV